jgi:hypothetical protein
LNEYLLNYLQQKQQLHENHRVVCLLNNSSVGERIESRSTVTAVEDRTAVVAFGRIGIVGRKPFGIVAVAGRSTETVEECTAAVVGDT